MIDGVRAPIIFMLSLKGFPQDVAVSLKPAIDMDRVCGDGVRFDGGLNVGGDYVTVTRVRFGKPSLSTCFLVLSSFGK